MTKGEYEKLRKAKSEARRKDRRVQKVKRSLEKTLMEISERKRELECENRDYVTGYLCGLSWVEALIEGVLDEAD